MTPVVRIIKVVSIQSIKYARGRGWGLKKEERNISITGVSGFSQKKNSYFRGIREAG
jgi:hypothetical protein